jgi:hypothetical protein
MTVYFIPVGTHGTIAAPGNQPKPHVARRQIRFVAPPELTEDGATFSFAKCRLTVPRAAVIKSDRDGLGTWTTIGT